MDGTMIVAAGTAACCFFGWLESYLHQRHLNRIPIRIHVNGTRGKSGVARLIAAGLRSGGVRTFAKTTGTLARAIFPSGEEFPIFRPGRTNVIEQVRMVRLAAQQQVDALVIECMALHPTLQSLCELKLVRSTHGVITNTRADHLDVMGPTAADVARALASTVPRQGTLFTAEQNHLPTLKHAAEDRNTRLVAVDETHVAQVSREELSRFPYVAHAENVALALQVCSDLGVDRDTALAGMWRAAPDPGAMQIIQARRGRQRVAMVNAFAANDPESTGKIWNDMVDRYRPYQTRIAVVNCRRDRESRSAQLAEAMVEWQAADHILLVGTGTEIFQRVALGQGLDPLAMVSLEGASAPTVGDEIFRRAGESAVVVGMGNTAGVGLALCDHLESKAVHQQDVGANLPPQLQEAA